MRHVENVGHGRRKWNNPICGWIFISCRNATKEESWRPIDSRTQRGLRRTADCCKEELAERNKESKRRTFTVKICWNPTRIVEEHTRLAYETVEQLTEQNTSKSSVDHNWKCWWEPATKHMLGECRRAGLNTQNNCAPISYHRWWTYRTRTHRRRTNKEIAHVYISVGRGPPQAMLFADDLVLCENTCMRRSRRAAWIMEKGYWK